MYQISDRQIDYMLHHLQQNGINNEDLQNNIVDHICCILEQQLLPEQHFESAFQNILSTFYNHHLKELEEETQNLLTFKNYYAMRKFMMYSGGIAAIVFAAGSFFKLMHWPGAGIMLVSAIFLFAFVFLPLVFVLKSKEVNSGLEKLTIALGTLLAILFCLDILFTIQHWPGATKLWFVTIALSFFIFIPIYFFSGIRKPETKVNTILTTIMLIGFTSLMFTMLSLKPKENLEVYNYLQNEQSLEGLVMVADEDVMINLSKDKIWQLSESIKTMITDGQQYKTAEALMLKQGSFRYENGITLVHELKAAVEKYNATTNDKALICNEGVLNYSDGKLVKTDNIAVLNTITQLQLAFLINKMQPVVKSVAIR